jgi:hypothetical protein
MRALVLLCAALAVLVVSLLGCDGGGSSSWGDAATVLVREPGARHE